MATAQETKDQLIGSQEAQPTLTQRPEQLSDLQRLEDDQQELNGIVEHRPTQPDPQVVVDDTSGQPVLTPANANPGEISLEGEHAKKALHQSIVEGVRWLFEFLFRQKAKEEFKKEE